MRKPRTNGTELWSVPIRVEDIPPTGSHFALVATPAVRSAIAASANLIALPRLEATFDVTRHGHGGARVVGDVSAHIGQTCVVTLEPLESTVSESVDVTFIPPSSAAAPSEDVLPPDGDDPPDILSADGVVDLGAVAVEHLLLGIDPYPRKPDAVFSEPPAGDAADEAARPFAALAALKKQGQGGH